MLWTSDTRNDCLRVLLIDCTIGTLMLEPGNSSVYE